MNQILQKFGRDLMTVFYLGGGFFLGLALFSYHSMDPSLNSIQVPLVAKNYCGLAGSFLADLFYQVFGISSWLFPLYFVIRGGQRIWGKNRVSSSLGNFLFLATFVLSFGTLLMSYWPKLTFFAEHVSLGGLAGSALYLALQSIFNSVGAQVVLWSLLLTQAVVYFEKDLTELVGGPTKALGYGFTSFLRRVFKKNQARISIASDFVKSGKTETQKIKFEIPFHKAKPTAEFSQNKERSAQDLEVEPREKLKAIRPVKRVENWEMPKTDLLDDPPEARVRLDRAEIQRKADLLKEKLLNFDIEGEITEARPGPLVTRYEFRPNADVKISKISELEDDLSLALSSESVRVMGHIPGRDVVGIETSNVRREIVYYKELISEKSFWKEDITLPMALGRDVEGVPKIVDLRKMPHLLIAGTTGSGKSVFVASIITGLIFKHSPKTLRLVLIDPKMVDLAHFAQIPHLILPHITESKKAASALRWAVREMEKRYRSLSQFGVSKLENYNQAVSELTQEQIKNHEAECENRYYFQPLPYIVIVIDELADLMVSEKQNIEQPIQRLTQMARACGMHVMIATQSPRKDVVTGLIKTNIPGRVALKVSSKMDSRIILDDSGAERLLPNGDMLFLAPGVNKPTRHHGPFLSDREIDRVVEFWAKQAEPEYDTLGLKVLDGFSGEALGDQSLSDDSMEEEYDERYDEILAWAADQKEVSASLIQRRFRLGYPRAARIIEIFEKEGIVGPANGSKPRAVIVNSPSL